MTPVWFLTFFLWGGEPGYGQANHQMSILRVATQSMAACNSTLAQMRFPPYGPSSFREGAQVSVTCTVADVSAPTFQHFEAPPPLPPGSAQ